MYKKLKNTGVAWLSSARVVKCLVKSFNERNSHSIFSFLFELLKYKMLIENS